MSAGPVGASIIVEISIIVGMAALALAGLFVAAAGLVRSLVFRRERRRRRLEERWMPVLLEAMRGEVDDWPSRRRREDVPLLAIVVRLLDTVEGSAADNLLAFLRRSSLADAAVRVLARGPGAGRLAAASIIGRLGDRRGVEPLRRLAEAAPLVLRTEASQALIRIEPEAELASVVPLLASWEDCHPAVAVAILEPAPPDLAADAVAEEVERSADLDRRLRLVEVLGSVPSRRGLLAVRRLLERTSEPELLARCLQVVREQRDPSDGPLVRGYLDHPVSFVRVQAVAALGRLRIRGDQWSIVPRLGDLDWWVRYRAAHALADLPDVSRPFLELLSRVHADRYARGALAQVLTERLASSPERARSAQPRPDHREPTGGARVGAGAGPR